MADLTQIFGGSAQGRAGQPTPGVAGGRQQFGPVPFGFTRALGGRVRNDLTGNLVRNFGLFGQQNQAVAPAPVATPTAPGDPGNVAAAQGRQAAAAEAGDADFTEPQVAGRREALLARRGRGVGLSSLGRGLGGARRVSDLLTTGPV